MGTEVIASIVTGILAGSLALIAFGGDSLVEMLSAAVVARHLKDDLSGSSRAGKGAAVLSSLLLAALVPVIGLGTAYAFFNGIRSGSSLLGIAIALGSLLMMPFLWHRKRTIGDEIRCLPLRIDSAESATCFLMSGALMFGLLARLFFGLWWADYIATAIILAFVSREAFESFRETGMLEMRSADDTVRIP
jgi:divalent metal cation (Fe/Co/Zn/Cd) transporter